MNAITEVPQTVAQMSSHHAETHQQPRVHRPRGLGEMLWGTRLAPALRRCLQGLGPGWHGLEKLEHRQHQGSDAHLLGLTALGDQSLFSQLEDSGACPPLGTHHRLEHIL
jgi:hypothetical protein